MSRYSSLTQIDTNNVTQLQIAWIYNTGDADSVNHSQIQCNPIVVDSFLFGTTPQMKLFAVNAATGKMKWVFNPFDSIANNNKRFFFIMNNSRGVAYWSDGKDDKRIFFTAGPNVFCVNATNGKLVTQFADSGTLDLHDGLDRDVKDLFVTATTPGVIYKDLLIMGTRVDEGAAAAPGHIRAFDVRTGKRQWIFHTIPHPGEFGFDTWEDSTAYKNIGGANNWNGMSVDEERGIVFVPTGSASYDFYGGKRKGANLFADCLLALDASTGKRIWHFQQIHHDVWDRDLPTPPALITVTHNGKKIDAVAQPTKTGFVYLFDRETGKPLFPIEERAVSYNSELIGEKLSQTQPFPTKPAPFVRQIFTENDINDLIPDTSREDLRKKLSTYKTGEMFMPPSKQGTIFFPGLDGGAEWGGPAFDPATGILYINANEMPWIITIADVKNEAPKKESNLDAGKRLYQSLCMSCHAPNREGGGNYPTLIGVSKKYSEKQFRDLVTGGRRMMPAFKQLSDDEIGAISSFVFDLKAKQKMTYNAPPKPIDTFLNLPYTITGYNKFLSKEGYPAIKPPWGTLNAIDMNKGEIVWKIPLGEYPEFKAKGIETGTENYGGPVVTAGGLVFIAATRDSKIRAFNKRTGKLLWEFELPAPGFATPAMYELNGKQYLVIACGGGKLGTKSSDAYVALAIPSAPSAVKK
ncbi:MAG TPA: PQQ-binding-like beta-propeller repeat protein [Chitinophagaceae bacterium]|nr:PQQ-binding-like beta-propeller repeat protein [Chitinophagaceae bacterium]